MTAHFKESNNSDPQKIDPIWKIKGVETQSFFSEDFLRMLLYVRNTHKNIFETIENSDNHSGVKRECTQKTWEASPERPLQGGGVMTVLRGEHLEKSAVNMSFVWGSNYPALETEYAGKPFAAAGVSLISHPKNPYAPIMHMNIRAITVMPTDGPAITWIGGGADLTPMIPFAEDTALFHDAMRLACEKNKALGDYPRFKSWADEYFYIPHRKESRGVGGIFFDFLKCDMAQGMEFLQDVGLASATAYEELLKRRVPMPFAEDLREKQLYWRGRYAEFNLLYDRGTRFGLMSGGNHEAIFCSMPPLLKW